MFGLYTLVITPPKWFPGPKSDHVLSHSNIPSDHHCPEDQAYTWEAKPQLMWPKHTPRQLHCLPLQPSPFATCKPQGKGFTASWTHHAPSCFQASTHVILFLENFYAFKPQHDCISVKHIPQLPQAELCVLLFLLMCGELYMHILMYLGFPWWLSDKESYVMQDTWVWFLG